MGASQIRKSTNLSFIALSLAKPAARLRISLLAKACPEPVEG